METKLTFRSSHCPHRKIWLEGTGMAGRLRSLAKSAKANQSPTIPTLFPPEIWRINTPDKMKQV